MVILYSCNSFSISHVPKKKQCSGSESVLPTKYTSKNSIFYSFLFFSFWTHQQFSELDDYFAAIFSMMIIQSQITDNLLSFYHNIVAFLLFKGHNLPH